MKFLFPSIVAAGFLLRACTSLGAIADTGSDAPGLADFFDGELEGTLTLLYPRSADREPRDDRSTLSCVRVLADTYIQCDGVLERPDGRERILRFHLNQVPDQDAYQFHFLYAFWYRQVSYRLSWNSEAGLYEGINTFITDEGETLYERIVIQVDEDGRCLNWPEYNWEEPEPEGTWTQYGDFRLCKVID